MEPVEMLRSILGHPNVFIGPGETALSMLVNKVGAMRSQGREKLLVR